MRSISAFIEHWAKSGGSERANYAMFLSELTEVLGVEKPLPATDTGAHDHYRLERPVASAAIGENTKKFIDLYRRGSFILETKQGTAAKVADPNQLTLPTLPEVKRTGHGVRGTRAWDKMMVQARGQADNYARGIAREDGWPPFIIVCDVGYVFEIYSDFSGQGHGYNQFPDGNSFRFFLEDLEKPEVQDLFRTIWNDPQSLDPSKRAAKVTREIADQLALLGRSFEKQGHEADRVAAFLMRCLFSMFAEDVDLIPKDSFSTLLKEMAKTPENAAPMLESLWTTMNAGGFSPVLRSTVLKFNGGLFADAEALPLDTQQIALLIGAANKDWKTVEPAIFGTLLERALDKRQRHKLGAHYTPRAYVERLVMPTVIEPLRADWDATRAAAYTLADQGNMKDARSTVHAFHRKLADTRVLDPACGSGNFLYVALELMKRLEGEVTALLEELGEDQTALGLASFTVDPHNFLGIELNPWAARVAELVLWIGYLQWHFRTYGKASPAEPVLRDFHNIENRDAVLDWDARRERRDAQGNLVTRRDGLGTILHNVTGERVPDPAARTQVWDYTKPRPAKWPEADFIIGNPPFIGNKRMRDLLGDGYTEAIRKAYPKVPDSADFVMFWWEKAALAARAYAPSKGKGCRRFGLITTNSLRQTFNRKVLETHLTDSRTPASLVFAIPDHPWVDAGEGAAVRIAMTVAEKGRTEGHLFTVASESKTEEGAEGRDVLLVMQKGTIFADLRVGADVAGVKALMANQDIAYQGVTPLGEGFRVSAPEAHQHQLAIRNGALRRYINGKQFIAAEVPAYIIDFIGNTETEARAQYPELFQQVLDRVKPTRVEQKRDSYKMNWWLFAETRVNIRKSSAGLSRFVATCRTAKHRVFGFLEGDILPDAKLIAICLDDAWLLAALSSRFHVTWAIASGAWLGVGNDANYNHAQCFNPFPFPTPTEPLKARLRQLGEDLDAHRKRQQALHPKLTLTAMYNILEKLRAGQRIEGKDKETYDQGLIGILRDLHDQIDAAVAESYGWPATLTEDDILHRLVALNRERTAEEANGQIRWLRPEYQNPTGTGTTAQTGALNLGDTPTATTTKPDWPKTLPEQVALVRDTLAAMGEATPDQLARNFKRTRAASVQPLLESMAALGLASKSAAGEYRPTR